jgi:tetratricopeptide (TPR) repeat protein
MPGYRLHYKIIVALGSLLLGWGCVTGHPARHEQNASETMERTAPNSYYYYTEAQILKSRGDTDAAVQMMQQALEGDPEALYVRRELATLYLQTKREDDALDLLQGILRDAPGDVPTLLIVGRIYQNRKDMAQAKIVYEKVLEQDPDKEDIYLLLGNLYMNDAQWDEAFHVFERMTTRFPGAYAGFFFLGKIYQERGDDNKAEQAFLKALAIEPALEGARFELIEIYQRRPDKTATQRKIIGLYQTILDEDPGNIYATCGLAWYYHRIHQDKKARPLLQALSETTSENDLVRVIYRMYLEHGKSREAAFILEEILRVRSDFGSLHYLLGVAYSDLEDTPRAMTHFKAVPPDSRFYRDAVIQQAFRYNEDDQIDAAIGLLETALSHEPDQVDFLIHLASLYKEKEAYENALALLERAIAVAPENERAYFQLGVVFDKMKRKDDSIAAMKQVIVLEPEHANALNYLGYTYADLGINLEEAENLVQKALTLKPDDGYITDSLGWVYYKQGRYQEALTLLLKAAELVADDPVVLEHVGDAYRKLGDKSKALEYYRKSLSMRETDREALTKKIQALERQIP